MFFTRIFSALWDFFSRIFGLQQRVPLKFFQFFCNRVDIKQDARWPAGYFPPQISSKKTTGQQICSLLTLFNIPIYEVCRKFDKNCIKNFWKILGFLSFSVSIWYIFHLENSHYLFGKAYWTTNSCHSCHVKRFQHSNPRSLSKIWQKLHKNVKNRKILEFFIIFGVIFLKKRIYLPKEYYWTTSSCLVERFQHSNPRCLSKKWQKLH